MRKWLSAALIVALVPMTANAENRCGWLSNPTPGNWWLTDGDGDWTIGAQGGYQADGMDNIGDMQEGEFVPMNGSHSYACFCMDVQTGRNSEIRRIFSAHQLSLAKCRRDPALTEPSDD